MQRHGAASGASHDSDAHVLPSATSINAARAKLVASVPAAGLGLEATVQHLNNDVVPGLNAASQSANYYGFVTGGATPAAAFADNLVTEHDQNVQVHLPNETIATDLEDRALVMLCEMLRLDPAAWSHRTFTTGATASNVIGLACGREWVISQHALRRRVRASVSEDGLTEAMRLTVIERILVLTTAPHSSLRKAASILGLGRNCVIDVGRADAPYRFDFMKLEEHLAMHDVKCIVVVSCAEVNTGLFATTAEDMRILRIMCNEDGAWLHVDAAFGLLARVLPSSGEYSSIAEGVAGLEIADSIAGDAHKLLNVPYDCGILLSRHLSTGLSVFQNPNAAYLNTASTETTASRDRTIPSPLNIGIENSRRFRALPVYASLVAYGTSGYRDMLCRQIHLARAIARYILDSAGYDLLPVAKSETSIEERLADIYIIVLFRARDESINKTLVQRVNGTRRLYISGTMWDDQPAARFAVANWQVDVERDMVLIKDVLDGVVRK